MRIEFGNLAKKCRRALRNDQGTSFSAAEFRMIAQLGLLEMLQTAEAEELKARWESPSANTQSATTGSRAATSRPSTRSPGTIRKAELRGIEALVANG
jgi:hypothetical protein